MAEIGTDITTAKLLLDAGELVAIPTETVYGLACNALDAGAAAKIFAVKNRPEFDPLIIHVPDLQHARLYVSAVPEKAKLLAENFWPGPLTLVLQKRALIPDLVSAGLDTVGVRCPDHLLTQKLLRALTYPLAAPSANPFGYVSPTAATHVNDQLGSKIDYILDGGASTIGLESTIIGFEGDVPVVYRLGGLALEQIQNVIGEVTLMPHSSSNPRAPGQLKSHYSPAIPLVTGDIKMLMHQHHGLRFGILSFKHDYNSTPQIILSESGSLHEAARNLFSALRQFDEMDIELIIAEYVPDTGLGLAINDRLRRASTRRS
ncbi:MAG: L-threonylcarbamoyladenylate synthase [Chryseolinea sp.]